MEPEEVFEVEDQDTHEYISLEEARVRKSEKMLAQLQATAGELEEQLELVGERMKGNEHETITEHLQKHDYALAIRRLSQEVEKLKFEKEYMNYLSHSMRNLRPPSNLYSVFLNEQLIYFRLSMVTMGYNDHIETKDRFIAAFFRSNNEEHDFLCELYMHNLVMTDYVDWDPNPHVEEVQLRAFMSFMRNHLRWNNVATAMENIEWKDALWVRGSP